MALSVRGRRAAAALLLLVLPLLSAACGGEGPGPATDEAPDHPPAGEVGLSGSVLQYRSDIARRVLTVRVRADAALDIGEVVVRPAGFDPGEPVSAATQLGAGNSVDLKISYGAARCDAPPTGATDALVDVVQDGRNRRVRLELQDPHHSINSLYEAECAERTVRRQVEFSFVGGWSPDRDGQLLRGTLRLRRLEGQAEVRVSELDGNVLFALRAGPPGGPVAVLAEQESEVTVPVEVEAARCDDHALAESKRTTAFGMFVSVDGSVLVKIVVNPDPPGREALVRFASDSCLSRR